MVLRRSRTLGLVGSGVLLTAAALTGLPGPAFAAGCNTTPSSVVAGISILDPGCGFASLDGSTVTSGILHGSAYRIEVPAHWNGNLVMFAHGYAGTGSVVSVSNPQLRRWYVDHGYAWAASSYRQNGYNVGDGVQDTHDLMAHFPGLARQRAPRDTYMTGLSMGGEITAVEVERYRGQYTAAMPYCGVLGANRLFDYFLGANVTAGALAHAPLQYPLTPAAGAAYTPTFVQTVQQREMPALGISAVTGKPYFSTTPTAAGQAWVSAVEQLSGGTRPGFPGALTGYWNSFGFAPLTTIPFLFGLYPGTTGGSIGYADGNVADNTRTTYQLDNDPAVSPAEKVLNEQVLRVAATNTATTNPARTELPDLAGTPGVPVLSLHDIGDLFVPLSMDQDYARQVASHGQGALFVDRAIRGTGHCEFSDNELAAGFSDLVSWAHTGTPPAGDAILDPAKVEQPTFGCRFTDPTAHHVFFSDTSCPS